MAKNITSVVWSATGLPSDLKIDPDKGIISGTPYVQPGDYIATVHVHTNYGDDEKQITIKVAVPESWKPVIDTPQTVYTIADEEMTPYTVRGQNVEKTKTN